MSKIVASKVKTPAKAQKPTLAKDEIAGKLQAGIGGLMKKKNNSKSPANKPPLGIKPKKEKVEQALASKIKDLMAKKIEQPTETPEAQNSILQKLNEKIVSTVKTSNETKDKKVKEKEAKLVNEKVKKGPVVKSQEKKPAKEEKAKK